jgi:uncharacterized caspase-like protein
MRWWASRNFSSKLDGARIVVFFYSGAAVQVAGKNYLLPVDAPLEKGTALAICAIDLVSMLASISANGRATLALLDIVR